jgi:hypothetical protein
VTISVSVRLLMLLCSLAVKIGASPAYSSSFVRVKTGAVVSDAGWSFGDICTWSVSSPNAGRRFALPLDNALQYNRLQS